MPDEGPAHESIFPKSIEIGKGFVAGWIDEILIPSSSLNLDC